MTLDTHTLRTLRGRAARTLQQTRCTVQLRADATLILQVLDRLAQAEDARPQERPLAVPPLARAMSDLRWYADRLCQDTPARYECYQTSDGTETRLSDACRVVVSRVRVLEDIIAAVAHQLTVGPASEGDQADVAWCARTLSALIAARPEGGPPCAAAPQAPAILDDVTVAVDALEELAP